MTELVKRHPRFWRTGFGEIANSKISVDETVTCNGQPSCVFSHEGANSEGSEGSENNERGYMLQTMGALPADGENSSSAASFSQKLKCVQWRGQRVCFGADISCKEVKDWAGLMMM